MAFQSSSSVESSIENDNYLKVLPRGELEIERLNNQHRFFLENLGYILHPTITSKFTNTHVHIADIGTGTGIFLRELTKSVPSTTSLHGFDISAAQFPPSEAVPENITFSVADAKLGFPCQHRGKYDIVHLRLLSPGMTSTRDWTCVARNAMSLLKPGGALQWSEESSAEKLTVLNQIPGGDHELSSLLHQTWKRISSHFHTKGQQNPFAYFGSVDLVSILEEVGMRDVRYEVTEFTKLPELRTPWTINVIECMRGVVESISVEIKKDEVDGLFERMLRLARKRRVYLRSDIHTHVAFKGDDGIAGQGKLFVRARL